MAIYLGIDQFTVMLFPKVEKLAEWKNIATNTVAFAERRLKVSDILGTISNEAIKPPQGYTVAFQYGMHNFYFVIAFHDMKPDMGIIIKFSARAFEYYREKHYQLYDEKINLNDILRWLSSNLYEIRCSRIDIYADYIDENIDITKLYNNLQCGTYVVRHANGRLNNSMQSALINDNKVATIYLGARRQKNNRILLRIYDKRAEQLKNPYAFKTETAMNCKNWVRFEVEFKQAYAHQLTELLMKVGDEQELISLLASSIISKYQFFNSDAGTVLDITQKLIQSASELIGLSLPKVEKNNELQKSIDYICDGSGLFPLIYKIEKIWGDTGVRELKQAVGSRYEQYEPNDDVIRWVKRNYDDLINTKFPYS